MTKLLLVGLGGFLGSILRYLLTGFVHRLGNGSLFPYGTIVVNVIGSLLIGFLMGLSESRGVFTGGSRLFIFIGFLGGFTTFSTFSYETVALLRDLQVVPALSNMLLHATLGLGGAWAGLILARTI